MVLKNAVRSASVRALSSRRTYLQAMVFLPAAAIFPSRLNCCTTRTYDFPGSVSSTVTCLPPMESNIGSALFRGVPSSSAWTSSQWNCDRTCPAPLRAFGCWTLMVVGLNGSTTISRPYMAKARRSISPYSFDATRSRMWRDVPIAFRDGCGWGGGGSDTRDQVRVRVQCM